MLSLKKLYLLLLITLTYAIVLPLRVFFALTTNMWSPPIFSNLFIWIDDKIEVIRKETRTKPSETFLYNYHLFFVVISWRLCCKGWLTWFIPLVALHTVGTFFWFFFYLIFLPFDFYRLWKYLRHEEIVELRSYLTSAQIPWWKQAPNLFHLIWAATALDASCRSFAVVYSINKSIRGGTGPKPSPQSLLYSIMRIIAVRYFLPVPFRSLVMAWHWSKPLIIRQWRESRSLTRRLAVLNLFGMWYESACVPSLGPFLELRIYRDESGPWNFNPNDFCPLARTLHSTIRTLIRLDLIELESGAGRVKALANIHPFHAIVCGNNSKIAWHMTTFYPEKLNEVKYDFLLKLKEDNPLKTSSVTYPEFRPEGKLKFLPITNFTHHPTLEKFVEGKVLLAFVALRLLEGAAGRGPTTSLIRETLLRSDEGIDKLLTFDKAISSEITPELIADATHNGLFWKSREENITKLFKELLRGDDSIVIFPILDHESQD